MKRQSNNKSGQTGVWYCDRDKNWRAYIQVDGKAINLGSHKNLKDAVAARKDAENRFWKGREMSRVVAKLSEAIRMHTLMLAKSEPIDGNPNNRIFTEGYSLAKIAKEVDERLDYGHAYRVMIEAGLLIQVTEEQRQAARAFGGMHAKFAAIEERMTALETRLAQVEEWQTNLEGK